MYRMQDKNDAFESIQDDIKDIENKMTTKQVDLAAIIFEIETYLSQRMENLNAKIEAERKKGSGIVNNIQNKLDEIKVEIDKLRKNEVHEDKDLENKLKAIDQIRDELVANINARKLIENNNIADDKNRNIEKFNRKLKQINILFASIRSFKAGDDKLYTELQQKLRTVENSLSGLIADGQKKCDLIKETKTAIMPLRIKIGAMKKSQERLSDSLNKAEAATHEALEFNRRKKELISEFAGDIKKMDEHLKSLNLNIRAAITISNQEDGLNLSKLSPQKKNEVLAVLKVIDKYLNISTGRKSPWFKKSARKKAKRLYDKLIAWNKEADIEKDRIWKELENIIDGHRILPGLARLFKVKTKSRKRYDLYRKQKPEDVENKIIDHLSGKIADETKLLEMQKTRKQIETIGKFENEVEEIHISIKSMQTNIEKYFQYYTGKREILTDVLKEKKGKINNLPKDIKAELRHFLNRIRLMFNVNVIDTITSGALQSNPRADRQKEIETAEQEKKSFDEKMEATIYSGEWLTDIKRFLREQKDALKLTMTYLRATKIKAGDIYGKMRKNQNLQKDKKYMHKLQKLKIDGRLQRCKDNIDLCRKIMQLAFGLYKKELRKADWCMHKIGKGDFDRNRSLQQDLKNGTKHVEKIGMFAVGNSEPKQFKSDAEERECLVKLLKEQKQESSQLYWKKWQEKLQGKWQFLTRMPLK
jgi:hypothetical protein